MALAGTVTEMAALLLFNKATFSRVAVGVLNVTVQASFTEPVTKAFAHLRLLTCGWFWPNMVAGKQQNRNIKKVMPRNPGRVARFLSVHGPFEWNE